METITNNPKETKMTNKATKTTKTTGSRRPFRNPKNVPYLGQRGRILRAWKIGDGKQTYALTIATGIVAIAYDTEALKKIAADYQMTLTEIDD